MEITSLSVKNFRNLEAQTLKLTGGLNIFFGANAQGKTNLLESVYLCSLGKSPRTDRDKDLICWGQTIAHVKTEYVSRYGSGAIAVGIDTTSGTKKHIAVNSVAITKLGDLLGYMNCVYFSPDEIKIVSASPSERRRFLDIDLCQTDKNYFYSLSRFNKALLQRNNLLKSSCDIERLKEVIFVWDKQIAENGAKVIAKRKNFCRMLKEIADKCHRQITDGQEGLALEYKTQIAGQTVDELTQNYLNALSDSLPRDLQQRFTTVGCQRDDIELVVNGCDIRHFGSQGQQRTTALSLKLAELEIFAKLTGEMPVLLLDDVLSELDLKRQKQLLTFSNQVQILLTTACEIDPSLLPAEYSKFTIKNGRAQQGQ